MTPQARKHVGNDPQLRTDCNNGLACCQELFSHFLVARGLRAAESGSLKVNRADNRARPSPDDILPEVLVMCGIFGYIGDSSAWRILVNGLKRLEYRGYDSAGLVTLDGGLHLLRTRGTVSALDRLASRTPPPGSLGIAHTRWATHGRPSVRNAHPHLDCSRRIAVVHNGIVDNYKALRAFLERKGHRFRSDTDTEVIAHLIEHFENGDFEQAVRKALQEVDGTYGLAVLRSGEQRLFVARRQSPIVIGIGRGEHLVASDPTALVDHTRKVVYLDDGHLASITRDALHIADLRRVRVSPQVKQIAWDVQAIDKGDYPHFMLKEIHEQPDRISDTMRGRMAVREGKAVLGGVRLTDEDIARARRVILSACGTSWHAGLVAEYWFEHLGGIPAEVEYATEFITKHPQLDERDIFIPISQSGETADTLEALRRAKAAGARTLGMVNVVGSSIARETECGVYIHVGPEIGVASTKAFTGHLCGLFLLSLYFGRRRGLPQDHARTMLRQLAHVPTLVQKVLSRSRKVKQLAARYAKARNFIYLGRGINFPVALEGALKLKEVSYIHAEGIPSAEMKHGPIALIDRQMPVLFLA
ncbi:MAG: glutamine--fructose-6-phosphate transaminase (isomerizing), partial [Planctomycetes bacterium]|nr:glutamine--fructose-6-phosphate transaminase (isomerizing) [Planctomycetota bacterium]